MSFKRDGDDKCALNIQRKRRVAELLNEDIEEDEVTRLSNGKYKCKLCWHQPVFDTLNMFYVHKQGKKHQISMEYAAQQKQELADLIEKRKHEHLAKTSHAETFKQTEGDNRTMDTSSKTTLGMKKPRRVYERKPVIDFDPSCNNRISIDPAGNNRIPIDLTQTTSDSQLPGNRGGNGRDKISIKLSKENVKIKSDAKTSNSHSVPEMYLTQDAGSIKGTKLFNMPCRGQSTSRHRGDDNAVVCTKDIHKLVGQSNSDLSNKFYLSRKKQRVEATSLVRNTGTGLIDSIHNLPAQSPTQTWEFYKGFKGGKVSVKLKSADKCEGKVSSGVEEPSDKVAQEDIVKKSSDTDGGKDTKEKKERAEKFLNAFGSGWKRDWTGAWVKDEDAEFDSDEEPPDVS